MRYLVAVLLVVAFMLAIGSSGCGMMAGAGEMVKGAGDDLSRGARALQNHMYADETPAGFAQK